MAQRTIPAPMTLLGKDSNLLTAQRGFEKVVIDSASQIEDYVPRMYKANTKANLKKFTSRVQAGLPRAQVWTNTNGLPAASGMQFLWDVDATHQWYYLGTETTLEDRTFDPYDIDPKIPTELGKGLGEMKQVLGADFFNDAFDTAWEDGVYFFSASHPYDSRIGGTQSNLVTGTVSVSMAAEAINKIINARDPLGRPLGLRPARVYCYPTQEMLWKQVLSTYAEYGTANRNESPFKSYPIEVVPYPWFDTTTKWVMQANDYELYYSQPVGVKTNMRETPSHSMRYEGWFAIAFWAEKWQGFVGGLGT